MDTSKPELRLTYSPTKDVDRLSVKIRVIYHRDSRRVALPIKEGVYLSLAEFEKLLKCHNGNYGRSSEKIRKVYDLIHPHLVRAKGIIDQLENFTFSEFTDLFKDVERVEEVPESQNDLLSALYRKAEAMRKQGRIGNANNYELAGKSLARYLVALSSSARLELGLPPLYGRDSTPVLTLPYQNLTPDVLSDYEAWMRNQGKAPKSKSGKAGPATLTTVGIYLRHVRAVFNDAIEEGFIGNDVYPFGKKRYIIPAGKNHKKALSRENIDLLKTYQPELNTFEQRSYDLFFFSYFCNGMNMTDIANLRWKNLNLKELTFSFIRGKTQRTKKENQVPVVGRLRAETLETIERWASHEKGSDNYVFPFLATEDPLTPQREREIIRQLVKVTNKYMRLIAGKMGIDSDITTYWARHSFATTLLRSEAPLGFISQSLGHSDIKTTQSYLGSFDDEQTKKYLDNL